MKNSIYYSQKTNLFTHKMPTLQWLIARVMIMTMNGEKHQTTTHDIFFFLKSKNWLINQFLRIALFLHRLLNAFITLQTAAENALPPPHSHTSRFPAYYLHKCFFILGMADIVLVNSQFTAKTFFSTFKSLHHIQPVVLYPSLNFDGFKKDISHIDSPLENKIPPSTKYIFLSINRYERKKNLNLAIEALNELKGMCTDEEWKAVQLVIAGKLGLPPQVRPTFFFIVR